MQAFQVVPCMATAMRRALCITFLSSAATAAFAQQPATGWQAGAVLDLSLGSRALAQGQRDKGLGLGHSDVTVRGPLGAHFEAQATAAAHSHERSGWRKGLLLPAGA